MSGLEITAFLIGLSGVAAVFDKTCDIWRAVTEASNYGEDVAKLMSKIEMEFFRFQMWWFALENVVSVHKGPTPTMRSSAPLMQHLQIEVQHPVVNAASNVLKLLESLQETLGKNGALTIARKANAAQAADPAAAASTATTSTLSLGVTRLTARYDAVAKELLKATSWFDRVRHRSAPWKEADQERLESIIKDLHFWNESLYSVLPHNIRESILQQGIAGYLLDSTGHALGLAQTARTGANQNPAVVEMAKLVELRQRMRLQSSDDNQKMQSRDDTLREAEKMDAMVGLLPNTFVASRPFSIQEYLDPQTAQESRVLVEWYLFPPSASGLETWNIAQERIARLSILLRHNTRPSTLHSPDTLGFITNIPAKSFGLIYKLPSWATSSLEPITLYHLLTRQIPGTPRRPAPFPIPPLPSLERRYELAAALARTIYTFMLTQWHHKRFNSTSVFFLFPSNGSSNISSGSQQTGSLAAAAIPDLARPFVGGYAISRPDAPSEDTFPGVPASHTDLYQHPALGRAGRAASRKAAAAPKFRRAFEVYSFGVLLAEIGFWSQVVRIAYGGSSSGSSSGGTGGSGGNHASKHIEPAELRQRLIRKCEADLACWMGERYREITLRCLRAEDVAAGGVGEDLNDFYWNVVLELVKCVPES